MILLILRAFLPIDPSVEPRPSGRCVAAAWLETGSGPPLRSRRMATSGRFLLQALWLALKANHRGGRRELTRLGGHSGASRLGRRPPLGHCAPWRESGSGSEGATQPSRRHRCGLICPSENAGRGWRICPGPTNFAAIKQRRIGGIWGDRTRSPPAQILGRIGRGGVAWTRGGVASRSVAPCRCSAAS
jgi:hypothetical protein